MKTNRFFAIAMAVCALSACSNEEGKTEEVGNSKLSIQIMGEKDGVTGRASGTTDETVESKVKNFILYVFKADGSKDIEPRAYTELPSNNEVSVTISTAATEVCIIANVKTDSELHTTLMGVTSKSTLQAVVGRGFEGIGKITNPTQTSTNLWMSGISTFTSPAEGATATAAVTLQYVAAKVRITKVNVDAGLTGLTLNQVIVLNGAGATQFIPTTGKSLIPSATPTETLPFYVSGVDMNFQNKPTYKGFNNEYFANVTGNITTDPSPTNQNYFYVFENNGTVFDALPTIVTLKCTKSGTECYYSVFFKMNTASEGYDDQVIERGKSYDITMDIKKLGGDDPTVPTPKTSVLVTITKAAWETVGIAKVYE